MDSKQISKLKEVSDAAKKPIIEHDLKDIIHRKIIVNKVTLEFLKTQKLLSENAKVLQYYYATNAAEKIDIVEQITSLFEEQYSVFDEDRQNEILDLYRKLHEIQKEPEEIKKILKTLASLDEKLKDLGSKIDYLEKSVPDVKEGTQYTIRKKEAEPCRSEY